VSACAQRVNCSLLTVPFVVVPALCSSRDKTADLQVSLDYKHFFSPNT